MARMARPLLSLSLIAIPVFAGCELDMVDPVPTEPMTLVGADRQSRIHLVDEGNGATTLFDTVYIEHPHELITASIPLGSVTSMEWVPTADMWWVGSGRTAACPNCLYHFVPEADSARLIRRLIQETDTIADFAVDPANGRVYTFKAGSGGYLFRVDLAWGWYDEVLRLDEGASGKGTTFWTDGNLYVAGGLHQQRLTRIELLRHEAEDVGPLTYVGFPPFAGYSVKVHAMATRESDGEVFSLVQNGAATFLATLDPTNAVVVNVGATTTPLNALAYVPTRLLR
jgi:hypothetical protein